MSHPTSYLMKERVNWSQFCNSAKKRLKSQIHRSLKGNLKTAVPAAWESKDTPKVNQCMPFSLKSRQWCVKISILMRNPSATISHLFHNKSISVPQNNHLELKTKSRIFTNSLHKRGDYHPNFQRAQTTSQNMRKISSEITQIHQVNLTSLIRKSK